jgi:hypothetical protein
LPATLEYFYKNNSNSKIGLNPKCKQCEREKALQNSKENLERTQKSKQEWHIKNREKVIKKCRKWREENQKHKQEYQLDYQRNNPDKMQKYGENRRHKKHDISDKEWQACLVYFNNECAYCGLKAEDHYNMYSGKLRKESLNKEHAIHNGANNISNCIPSCKSCNDRKWEYDYDEWYKPDNPNYTEERLNKIHKWLNKDYKKDTY